MANSAVGKTVENARKHRDIKLVITVKRRSYLVSEPNYHTTKWFSENLLAMEMNETKVKVNRPLYLRLSILNTCKTVIIDLDTIDSLGTSYQIILLGAQK